jgi:hypothetical protein
MELLSESVSPNPGNSFVGLVLPEDLHAELTWMKGLTWDEFKLFLKERNYILNWTYLESRYPGFMIWSIDRKSGYIQKRSSVPVLRFRKTKETS